jgi:hypothetical protein
MPHPTRVRRQAQFRNQQVRITYLGWWMPSATSLTRAITEAILDARGLLADMPGSRPPHPQADRGQAVRHAG